MKMIKKTGITGAQLKIIAIVTMLIDHIGACFIENGLLHGYNDEVYAIMNTQWGESWYMVDTVLRCIGRISAPIFFFLLVEGFLHTHNMKKYIIQMLVFALLSEIPYDLAFSHALYDPIAQNIFFTLSIGLFVLIGIKVFENNTFLKIIVILFGCFISYVLQTDYAIVGILMIVSFYVFHENPLWRNMCIAAIVLYESSSVIFSAFAVLALIPISEYRGEKGQTRLHKYVFYAFYPIHLCILAFLMFGVTGL